MAIKIPTEETRRPMTPQQRDLWRHAGELAWMLDETIPATTIHYAVEDLRKALHVFTMAMASPSRVTTLDAR